MTAAARNSIMCTALTGVTPGTICGSVHDGGVLPQARCASATAVRSSMTCIALIDVTP